MLASLEQKELAIGTRKVLETKLVTLIGVEMFLSKYWILANCDKSIPGPRSILLRATGSGMASVPVSVSESRA